VATAKEPGSIESEFDAAEMPSNLHFLPFDGTTTSDPELDISPEELGASDYGTPPALDFIPEQGSIPEELLDNIAKTSKTKATKTSKEATKTPKASTKTAAQEVTEIGEQGQDAKPKKKKNRWTEEQKAAHKAAKEALMARNREVPGDTKGKRALANAGSKPFGDKTKAAKVAKEQPAKPETSEDEKRPKVYREKWQEQKAALREKFPEGWAPRKKLSPDALAGIRALHQQFPNEYTTPVLAEKFQVSAEAIRRILRSKWEPSPEEEEDRERRWFERGKKVWSRNAELGMKPPRKWRAEGIVRDPIWNEKKSEPGKKRIVLDRPVPPEVKARWEREKRERAQQELSNNYM